MKPVPGVKNIKPSSLEEFLGLIKNANFVFTASYHGMLFSMAEAMAEAIDGRTPYNASHTKNVAKRCVEMLDYIKSLPEFNAKVFKQVTDIDVEAK